MLKTLDERATVVAPIGFLSDHVEVLYDLDIEAAGVAREHGIRFERAPTVGDHPDFIAMMASIVRSHRG
jgi:protoporphyrin/coproporphyrin ferrochelatase